MDFPTRYIICARFLAEYIITGKTIPGTLLERLVKNGISPVESMTHVFPAYELSNDSDGVVDSLRYLVSHENFNKPYCDEHVLAVLLTKAF